ncbi:hypothetical protein PJP10_32050, partial [Mycobacterium kansasii]
MALYLDALEVKIHIAFLKKKKNKYAYWSFFFLNVQLVEVKWIIEMTTIQRPNLVGQGRCIHGAHSDRLDDSRVSLEHHSVFM